MADWVFLKVTPGRGLVGNGMPLDPSASLWWDEQQTTSPPPPPPNVVGVARGQGAATDPGRPYIASSMDDYNDHDSEQGRTTGRGGAALLERSPALVLIGAVGTLPSAHHSTVEVWPVRKAGGVGNGGGRS